MYGLDLKNYKKASISTIIISIIFMSIYHAGLYENVNYVIDVIYTFILLIYAQINTYIVGFKGDKYIKNYYNSIYNKFHTGDIIRPDFIIFMCLAEKRKSSHSLKELDDFFIDPYFDVIRRDSIVYVIYGILIMLYSFVFLIISFIIKCI